MLRKLLAVASACIMPALSANVHAAAYAVSYTTISNFHMTLTGVSLGDFTGSVSSASLGPLLAVNSGFFDTPASCLGCGYTNDFANHGLLANSSNYSYGDARIYDPDPVSATPLSSLAQLNNLIFAGSGAASAIGEAAVVNGMADGLGSNSLNGLLVVDGGGGSVSFKFDAPTYLWAGLTNGGQQATAQSRMEISIADYFTGTSAFNWACDGKESKGQDNASIAPTCLSNFSAGQTISLAGGFYNFSIQMKNSVHVESAQVVPLPAASWLLFSGLAGLVALARARE